MTFTKNMSHKPDQNGSYKQLFENWKISIFTKQAANAKIKTQTHTETNLSISKAKWAPAKPFQSFVPNRHISVNSNFVYNIRT